MSAPCVRIDLAHLIGAWNLPYCCIDHLYRLGLELEVSLCQPVQALLLLVSTALRLDALHLDHHLTSPMYALEF